MVPRIKLQDLELSRLVYGYWRAVEWDFDTKETVDHINYCLDLGITSFDHADIYGDYTCEALFGRALKEEPSLRDKMEIITKCGIKLISKNRPDHKIKTYDTSYDHIIWSAENSLMELGTDRIDLLLIHRPSPLINPAEVAKAFQQLKKEGKVLHFGVSNFTIQQFKTLSSYLDFPLITNQVEISAQCLDAFDDGNIDFFQEIKLQPMAWSPLGGGGIFTSSNEEVTRLRNQLEKVKAEIGADSIDQVLLNWLLKHPVGIIPVLGTGKRERIKASAKSCDLSMTDEQWFEILEASRGIEVP